MIRRSSIAKRLDSIMGTVVVVAFLFLVNLIDICLDLDQNENLS
jgi:hypothetical protein